MLCDLDQDTLDDIETKLYGLVHHAHSQNGIITINVESDVQEINTVIESDFKINKEQAVETNNLSLHQETNLPTNTNYPTEKSPEVNPEINLSSELDYEALQELEVQLYSQIYHGCSEEASSLKNTVVEDQTESKIFKLDNTPAPASTSFQPRKAIVYKRYYNNSTITRVIKEDHRESANKSPEMNSRNYTPNIIQNFLNISPIIQITTPQVPVNHIVIIPQNLAQPVNTATPNTTRSKPQSLSSIRRRNRRRKKRCEAKQTKQNVLVIDGEGENANVNSFTNPFASRSQEEKIGACYDHLNPQQNKNQCKIPADGSPLLSKYSSVTKQNFSRNPRRSPNVNKSFNSTNTYIKSASKIEQNDIICLSEDDTIIIKNNPQENDVCIISSDDEYNDTTIVNNITPIKKQERESFLNALPNAESTPFANGRKDLFTCTTLKNEESSECKLETDCSKPNDYEDDVIFIEPKPLEVIDIDCDLKANIKVDSRHISKPSATPPLQQNLCSESNLLNPLIHSSPSNKETKRNTPHKSKRKQKEKQKLQTAQVVAERRELLSTPDSTASNDFIDNTLVNQQSKFNFDLHGTDFGPFVKPKPQDEIYETESSCSASDVMTPSKTSVFNEIEFDTPSKRIFDENNLQTFGDFITPKRKLSTLDILSTNVDEQIITKAALSCTAGKTKRVIRDSSESSSESEYGDANVQNKIPVPQKIRKRLPSLSPIHSDAEPSTSAGNKESSTRSVGKQKKKQKKAKQILKCDETTNESKNSSLNMEYGETELDHSNIIDTTVDAKSNIDCQIGNKKRKKLRSFSSENTDDQSNLKKNLKKTDIYESNRKRKSDSNEQDTDGTHRKKKSKKRSESGNDNFDSTETFTEVTKETVDEVDHPTDSVKIADDEIIHTDVNSQVINYDNKTTQNPSESKEVNQDDDSEFINLLEEIDVEFSMDGTDSSDDVCIVEDKNEPIVLSDDDDNMSSVSSETFFESLNINDRDIKIANCSDFVTSKNYQRQSLAPDAQQKGFSNFWTHDMKKFYTESWGLQNFSVSEEHKKMSDNPSLWKILDRDRIHMKLANTRGTRCHRCREVGHFAINCPNKSGPPVCRLCGSKGHIDLRCNNKLCSNCGRKGPYSTVYCNYCATDRNAKCKLCKVRGHITGRCSDLWRRYYLTTEPGLLVRGEGLSMKPVSERWCSGCGKGGHFEFACNKYNRTHPPCNPTIRSYENVYPTSHILQSTSYQSSEISRREINKRNRLDNIKRISLGNLESNQLPMLQSELLPTPIAPVVPNFYKHDINPRRTLHNLQLNPFAMTSSENSTIVRNQHIRFEEQQPEFIAFENFNSMNGEDSELRSVSKNRHISKDLSVKVHNDSFDSQNTIVIDSLENVEDHQVVYYLNLNEAHFLKEDDPGIQYLLSLENDLNVKIAVTIESISSLCLIKICGPKEKNNFAREVIDLFVHQELPHFRVPSNSKAVGQFIQENFMKCQRFYNPKELFSNIEKIEERKMLCKDFKAVVDLSTELRDLYCRLNVGLFGKYKLDESEYHLAVLRNSRDLYCNIDASNISAKSRSNIQRSFNYLFYNRRSKEMYRNYINIIKFNMAAQSEADFIVSPIKTNVPASKFTGDKMKSTIEQQYKHFSNVRKKISLRDDFVVDLPKLYCKFNENPIFDNYDKFNKKYMQMLRHLQQLKRSK